MDSLILTYKSVPFVDLNICFEEGIAFQNEMTVSVRYDKEYFMKYKAYENTELSNSINNGRINSVKKYCSSILDIGIGSGEFIKRIDIPSYGYDINELAIEWLKENQKFADPYKNMPNVDGLTFWDTMEHIPNPYELLSKIPSGKYVFITMPIFDNLLSIKNSKHYRPNEHYYYFTAKGLIRYMDDAGFDVIEIDDYEIRSGRESIYSFIFLKR